MKDTTRVDELIKIAKKHDGVLKAIDVIEEARDESSPLHSAFTWDDSKAAHEYRLEQARRLIRVVVQTVEFKQKSREIRVFVSLSPDRYNEDGGGGYRPMVDVLSNADMRAQLLTDALEDMRGFQDRYRALKELVDVFAAMKKATTKIQKTVKSRLAG
jgi:hypothetical protein